MIEVCNLTKKFATITALDNVSFKAEKGDIITLLGPNGAGKTTLIRCLCGYLTLDSGNIIINGAELGNNLILALQNIGYMPENTPLYNEMKVYEYLQFVAGIYRLPPEKFQQNLAKVISELDIQNVINQKIATLSKGYRRRVGVAAVMIHEPQILILDEPTEGLDPNQKIALRRYLKEYSRQALVIISTHLLEEADALASRVIVLNHGKIVSDTTVAKFKKEAPKGNLAQLFYNLTNGDANVE